VAPRDAPRLDDTLRSPWAIARETRRHREVRMGASVRGRLDLVHWSIECA